jgi:hypothetical protein
MASTRKRGHASGWKGTTLGSVLGFFVGIVACGGRDARPR